jgi:hypothetical protein
MDFKEAGCGIVDSNLIKGSHEHGSGPLNSTKCKELTNQLLYSASAGIRLSGELLAEDNGQLGRNM